MSGFGPKRTFPDCAPMSAFGGKADIGRWRFNVQSKDDALEFFMKLYVTFTSPYARLARILVLEKALEDRVEILAAKTRVADSPYYQINPSGRVPYLIDDSGIGIEDSKLICAYLDNLDGKPRFHDTARQTDWAYQRHEFAARELASRI